jgi:hypothetical protein
MKLKLDDLPLQKTLGYIGTVGGELSPWEFENGNSRNHNLGISADTKQRPTGHLNHLLNIRAKSQVKNRHKEIEIDNQNVGNRW